jgi:hypothetical protein
MSLFLSGTLFLHLHHGCFATVGTPYTRRFRRLITTRVMPIRRLTAQTGQPFYRQ